MPDVFPKFIVEGDALVIGRCTYHRELVVNEKNVKGGGAWRWSDDKKTFILFGNSFDYGQAKIEDIISCIAAGKAYTNKSQIHSISEDYNFEYDENGTITDLKTPTNA